MNKQILRRLIYAGLTVITIVACIYTVKWTDKYPTYYDVKGTVTRTNDEVGYTRGEKYHAYTVYFEPEDKVTFSRECFMDVTRSEYINFWPGKRVTFKYVPIENCMLSSKFEDIEFFHNIGVVAVIIEFVAGLIFLFGALGFGLERR
jgi:hypothetical protein